MLKREIILTILLSVSILTVSGCLDAAKPKTESVADNSISGTISASASSISEAADNANIATSVTYGIAFNENSVKKEQRTGFRKLLYGIIDTLAGGKDLYAGVAPALQFTLCKSGSVTPNVVAGSWGTAADTDIYKELSYSGCKLNNSFYSISGSALFHWSGLNNSATGISKIIPGTKLEQALSGKDLTNSISGAVISVDGNGTLISDTTVPGQTGGTFTNVPVAHTITFNSLTSYSLETSLTRTKTTQDGKTVFQHTITTPVPLAISISGTTRTISSGTLKINHDLAGFAVTLVFTNVTQTMGSPLPTGGTIAVTITGSKTGSGAITFTGTTTPSVSGATGALTETVSVDL